jgi:hypothetical protein
VWIAAAATVVAVTALALLFRERPPYDFLRGAVRVRTTIQSDPVAPDYTGTIYVCDLSIDEVRKLAREELLSIGWEVDGRSVDGGSIVSPDTGKHGSVVEIGSYPMAILRPSRDPRLRDKTVITLYTPATTTDRFRAWLDRITNR